MDSGRGGPLTVEMMASVGLLVLLVFAYLILSLFALVKYLRVSQ